MAKLNHKCSIDDRRVNICGTVNFQNVSHNESDILNLKGLFLENLEHIPYLENYFYIVHDETNIVHVHFLFMFKKQMYLKTVLNKLSELYDVSTDAITIDENKFIGKYLKYIIHQSKESIEDGKKSYIIQDIISNLCTEIVEGYINSGDNEIDSSMLINLCLDTPFEVDLLQLLPLNIYHRYRYEIRLIYENISHLRHNRELEREKRLNEDLPF